MSVEMANAFTSSDVCSGAAVCIGCRADGRAGLRRPCSPSAPHGDPSGHSFGRVTAWSATRRPLASAVVHDHAAAVPERGDKACEEAPLVSFLDEHCRPPAHSGRRHVLAEVDVVVLRVSAKVYANQAVKEAG